MSDFLDFNNYVVVLHPSDELKVISFQKDLYKKIKGGNEQRVFRSFPLWFFFPTINENVSEKLEEINSPKKLSEKIKSIEISGLQKDGDFIYLIGKFDIELSDTSSLKLEGKMKMLQGNFTGEIKGENSFSLSPRIFRCAIFHQEGKSYWLTDSSWRKLKKN